MTREARSMRCPESVLGWIPWYGEGTEDGESLLSLRQRGAVEAHAAQCADCRAELDMIAGAPFEIDVDLPDPDRMFEAITARIDAGEAETPDAGLLSPVIPIDRGRALEPADYEKVARWVLDESSERERRPTSGRRSGPIARVIEGPWTRSTAWAAAAALVLVSLGALGGALLAGVGSQADPSASYELASAEVAATRTADRAMIDVVFVESASVSEISAALRRMGVEIVSGPTKMGVYRLQATAHRNVDGRPGTDSSAAEVAAIAARLKANAAPIVIFAEPVP